MNYYGDSAEWKYLFRNAIDWDRIIALYHPQFPTPEGFQNREELLTFYEELLLTTGQWAAESLEPRAAVLDQTGGAQLKQGQVELSDVLKQTYSEAGNLGLFGITIEPKYAGLGAPFSLGLLMLEQISRACFASSAQLGFFSCIADMLQRFCSQELCEKYIPRILRGEISGSMCLTEPNSGSDLGSLRTSAERQPDGTYLIQGTKCFITNGCGGLAFILARVKNAPSGLSGISLFFAEEWMDLPDGTKKQNYQVTRLEEKMGLHGSPTCEVVYENTRAQLIGQENQGVHLMFYLMNEARISVGLQALGGIEASLSHVSAYAHSRKQFDQPLAQLPLFKRNLQDWETERDAFRALMVDTVSHFDIFQKLHLKKQQGLLLSDQEQEWHDASSKKIRQRTPLVKYYGAETHTLLSQRAIQAFGGYGFMREYPVERLHRDSFGALLYEGTSQIQALMAMKDFIKDILRNPGRWIQEVFTQHPWGPQWMGSTYKRSLASFQYDFKKNILGLLLRSLALNGDHTGKNASNLLKDWNRIWKKSYWENAERFHRFMIHAETLCQCLAYLECLDVLATHASRDESRGELYRRYSRLVSPRLAGIYTDWKLS